MNSLSMLRRVRSALAAPVLWLVVATLALAATTYTDFLAAIARRESSMNPNAVNAAGYVGLFQMGTMAMTDAGYYRPNGTAHNSWAGTWTGKDGLTSLTQFKSDPDLQIKAVHEYYNKLQSYISTMGLGSYVGQTINGVPVTYSGLIAGAHLVGIGALRSYLTSGGTVVPKDGNGVPVTTYMSQFGGYTIGGAVPSYAALRAANPTGGVSGPPPVVTPPVLPPFTGAPTTSGNMDQAFYDHTGYTMPQVSMLVRQLVCALIFAWLGWSLVGSFRVFRTGGAPIHLFFRDNVRSLGVMVVMLWFVVT